MPDVYIAHAIKDVAFARKLDQALKEKGLETWACYKDSPEDMALARQALKERGLDKTLDFDDVYEELAFVSARNPSNREHAEKR